LTTLSPPDIDFDKGGGLAPVVVQDAATLQVLMLAWMDRAALEETVASGEATFFSRSRGGRWRKGETSGNRLKVVTLTPDCDRDTLVLTVRPTGPACHLGTVSCFGSGDAPGLGELARLEATIASRPSDPDASGYTSRLKAEGVRRVAQKVGEEGVETALAGVAGDDGELAAEAADLLYHLIVLLNVRGLALEDVIRVLRSRRDLSRSSPSSPGV
jgi:phosphoribosyl-ATP pyrophosphohydrolase/phosphoribosyl-AMP cyclohydrolase